MWRLATSSNFPIHCEKFSDLAVDSLEFRPRKVGHLQKSLFTANSHKKVDNRTIGNPILHRDWDGLELWETRLAHHAEELLRLQELQRLLQRLLL